MQQFIPIVSVPCTNHPIWFNSEIRHHIKQLRTLRRKCSKHDTTNNVTKLKSLESLLSAKVSAAKSDYETNLVASINNNNSSIYKYIKALPNLALFHLPFFMTRLQQPLMLIRLIYSISFSFLFLKVAHHLALLINYLISIQYLK